MDKKYSNQFTIFSTSHKTSLFVYPCNYPLSPALSLATRTEIRDNILELSCPGRIENDKNWSLIKAEDVSAVSVSTSDPLTLSHSHKSIVDATAECREGVVNVSKESSHFSIHR